MGVAYSTHNLGTIFIILIEGHYTTGTITHTGHFPQQLPTALAWEVM